MGNMPELTIFLDEELILRLDDEASQRGLTTSKLIPKLLREQLHLPLPDPQPASGIDLLMLWRMTPEELVALLESSDAAVRAQAKDHLKTRGESVFDALEKALAHPREKVALTAAELLAKSASNLAIRPLLVAYAGAKKPLKPELLHELRRLQERFPSLPVSAWNAIHVCTPVTAPLVSRMLKETQKLYIRPNDTLSAQPLFSTQDITSLIFLLKWQRTGETARQVASALTQAASTSPCPELRYALPLLHPSWRHPLVPTEFTEAAKAIEAATAPWKDLPLPASPDDKPEAQDLPLPVENVP